MDMKPMTFAMACVIVLNGLADVEPQGVELVDLTSPGGTAFSLSASDGGWWYDGKHYGYAFNDDWGDRAVINRTAVDIGYSFEKPTVVNAYRIYLPTEEKYLTVHRGPSAWTFQGSDDQQSWYDLDVREGVSEWSLGEGKYFQFENKMAYRHYRLNMTAVADAEQGNGYLQVAEIEFFNVAEKESVELERQVQMSVVGVPDDVTLANFPVLVRLSPQTVPGFRHSQFRRDDHADLLFVDEDGYYLPYEIDTWDESGTSLVWVRIRNLVKGAAFTMCYGGAEAVRNQPETVWSAYAAVYHFNGSQVDSGKASIPYSLRGTAALSTDGIVGGGFASGSAGAATCGQPWSEIPGSPSKSIAISGWVKPAAEVTATTRIFSTKGSDYTENGVELMFVPTGGVYFRGNGGSVTWTWTPDPIASAYPAGEWTHYVASLEGNNISFFLNGVQPAETGWVWDFQPRGDRYLSFGAVATDACGNAVNGLLDELRVYRGAMPADWAKAEYDSVHDAGFLVYGAVSAVHQGLMTIIR